MDLIISNYPKTLVNVALTGTVCGPVGKHQWDVRLVDFMNNNYAKVSHQSTSWKNKFNIGTGSRCCGAFDAPFYKTYHFPLISPSLLALEVASHMCLYRCYCDVHLLRSRLCCTSRVRNSAAW